MNKIDNAEGIENFCNLVLNHHNEAEKTRHVLDSHRLQKVLTEKGRKYDKVIFSWNGRDEVRYFVERKTGTIYGAKSHLAPNMNWYFGTLSTAHLWDWSDVHGRPVNDDSVRPVGRYGPYTRYMKI